MADRSDHDAPIWVITMAGIRSHALDGSALYSLPQGSIREADDSKRRIGHGRLARLCADSEPDLERCLRSQVMELERREQADDAMGNKGSGRGQTTVLRGLEPSRSVEAPTDLLELARADHSTDRQPRRSLGLEVPRPHEPLGNLGQVRLVTFRRHLLLTTDILLHR
jgi:hypothetical protein